MNGTTQNTTTHPILDLPKKVVVKTRLTSRYDHFYAEGRLESGGRPMLWENRVEGLDRILTDQGEELVLYSDGQQSPPSAGWVVMLTEKKADGYAWTLYGLPSA
jgi:hypothetical protein